jgi:predicted nucleic acid-binding protein
MGGLVLDASALAAAILPDEGGPDLAPFLAAEAVFRAPWLLWAEIRNILIVLERRGRLPEGFADEALAAIDGLGIALDAAPAGAEVLRLARRHGLTVYDALYLELALRSGAGLVTRDRVLAAAALAEGVSLAAYDRAGAPGAAGRGSGGERGAS